MFSTQSKTEIIILSTFNLLSENALNLVQSEKIVVRLRVKGKQWTSLDIFFVFR